MPIFVMVHPSTVGHSSYSISAQFHNAPKQTAIVEVKGISICGLRYGLRHRNPTRPYGSSKTDRITDRRAWDVKQSCSQVSSYGQEVC
jgi:hypothetical protein